MTSIRRFFLLRCRIETQHKQLQLLGFIHTRSQRINARLQGMEDTPGKGSLSHMKPLLSESQDTQALQELGRASVQIVHDLKNQLNGLKLYATFLRKRMEKSERPEDEQETIGKLIAGLERAAADMSALVRFGRPLELRRQADVDLAKIVNALSEGDDGPALILHAEPGAFEGEFDVAALTEALKAITAGAINLRQPDGNGALQIHLRAEKPAANQRTAVIEWRSVSSNETDPFHSFAGSAALRMSLAAKIVAAHGGETEQQADALRVRLPLQGNDG